MHRLLFGSAALLALCLGQFAAAADDKEAKKTEAKAAQEPRRRPSDVVFLLIEMSDADKGSHEELQRLYGVLRKLDKNNDGKIDAGELKAVREQLIDDRVDHIFSKLDTNKDGKIGKDEAQGRIKEHFDRLDADRDGFITRAELRQAITAHARAAVKGAPAKE